jgi:hypothetical protein
MMPNVINSFEQYHRVNKATILAGVLHEAGIKSWQVEQFNGWQWQQAFMAAKVNPPRLETRLLVVVLMRQKEENAVRLSRAYSGCVEAIANVA